MSENLLAKEKINDITTSLLRQSEAFIQHIKSYSEQTKNSANNINNIILNMQFQDRAAQYLNYSSDTLMFVSKLFDSIKGQISSANITVNMSENELVKEIGKVLKLSKLNEFLLNNLTSMNCISFTDDIKSMLNDKQSDEGETVLF